MANGVEEYPFADAESCDIFQKFDDYRHERNLKVSGFRSGIKDMEP